MADSCESYIFEQLEKTTNQLEKALEFGTKMHHAVGYQLMIAEILQKNLHLSEQDGEEIISLDPFFEDLDGDDFKRLRVYFFGKKKEENEEET